MNTTDPRIISLAAFARRNIKAVRPLSREALIAWVTWYFRHGYVGVIRERGRIVSAAFARPIDAIEHGQEPYKHSEAGRIIWVDEIASRHPDGIMHLFGHTIRRFGPREYFAGLCLSRCGELRMLPWSAVQRFTMTSSDNGIPIHSRSS